MNLTDHLYLPQRAAVPSLNPLMSHGEVSLSALVFIMNCYINGHTQDKHLTGIMHTVHSSLKLDMTVINNFLRQPQALSALPSETFLLDIATLTSHSHGEDAV